MLATENMEIINNMIIPEEVCKLLKVRRVCFAQDFAFMPVSGGLFFFQRLRERNGKETAAQACEGCILRRLYLKPVWVRLPAGWKLSWRR